MFVIAYIPSNEPVTIQEIPGGLTIAGKWRVDVEEDGSLAKIEELETALDRVKFIREKGGEACLLAIIE